MHLLILILLSLTTLLPNSWLFTLYINNLWQCTKDEPRGGPAGPPWFQIFLFIVILYFIFVFSPLLANQSSQPNSNSNFPTQKLNKNNKNIHNDDWILAKKKQFYHQRTKKSCVIGEAKTKFFTTTVNQYKYQLTVPSR